MISQMRVYRLAQELIMRGQPIAHGNAGHCVYCSAQESLDSDRPTRHFDDCAWEALRAELRIDVTQ